MNTKEHIHVVGIGGIGVSALARFFAHQGARVTGSDVADSALIHELRKEGIAVAVGPHDAAHVPANTTKIIYSVAAEENPEILAAKKRGIPMQTYPEALGELLQGYTVIAVAGTHGKSTTTTMVAQILIEAGLDPSVIVGTTAALLDGKNFRIGKSKWFIIEADEYRRAFHHYTPTIACVLNIDPDHFDVYPDLPSYQQSFATFVGRTVATGTLVLGAGVREQLAVFHVLGARSVVDVVLPQTPFDLRVPGGFNQTNAAAALACAQAAGVGEDVARRALAKFAGTWRRFERKGTIPGTQVDVVDDYAHHPTAIRVTVEAAREVFHNRHLTAVVQIHHWSRVKYLFHDFVRVLAALPVDTLILADYYKVQGRDDDAAIADLPASLMFEEIRKTDPKAREVIFLPTLPEIEAYLRGHVHEPGAIIFLSAGDLTHVANNLVRKAPAGKTDTKAAV